MVLCTLYDASLVHHLLCAGRRRRCPMDHTATLLCMHATIKIVAFRLSIPSSIHLPLLNLRNPSLNHLRHLLYSLVYRIVIYRVYNMLLGLVADTMITEVVWVIFGRGPPKSADVTQFSMTQRPRPLQFHS